MMIGFSQFSIFIIILTHIQISNSERERCDRLGKLLRTATDQQTKTIIEQLQEIKCLTAITPRYKWSQNMSHIQVKIEFSATTETTPCDQLLYRNTTAVHNSFDVRVICSHAQFLIDYRLTVLTFKSLDFQFAQWKNGEQNSIILECMKSPAPYFWPILHSRTHRPGRAPKIWWQMLSRYGPELRKVIDLLEIGDEDHEISKKVKRKLKKPEREFGGNLLCNRGSPQYLGSWL